MSFISIVGTTKFISIMSDGRASENGVPVMENYKKIDELNNNFVAFTGMEEYCIPLKNLVLDLLQSGADYRSIGDKAQVEIGKIKSKNGKINLSFGGKNSEGVFEFFTLSTSQERYQIQRPIGDKIEFMYLGSPALIKSGLNINERFGKYLNELKGEIDQIQKRLNDDVAEIDISVNKNTFHLVIQ